MEYLSPLRRDTLAPSAFQLLQTLQPRLDLGELLKPFQSLQDSGEAALDCLLGRPALGLGVTPLGVSGWGVVDLPLVDRDVVPGSDRPHWRRGSSVGLDLGRR